MKNFWSTDSDACSNRCVKLNITASSKHVNIPIFSWQSFWDFWVTILPASVARRNSRGDSAARKIAVHASAVPAQRKSGGCFFFTFFFLLSAVLARWKIQTLRATGTGSHEEGKHEKNKTFQILKLLKSQKSRSGQFLFWSYSM